MLAPDVELVYSSGDFACKNQSEQRCMFIWLNIW